MLYVWKPIAAIDLSPWSQRRQVEDARSRGYENSTKIERRQVEDTRTRQNSATSRGSRGDNTTDFFCRVLVFSPCRPIDLCQVFVVFSYCRASTSRIVDFSPLNSVEFSYPRLLASEVKAIVMRTNSILF